MTNKQRTAVVFVHGLARKPKPDVLMQIWLEALAVDNPRPDTFPGPNRGVRPARPVFFTYYADTFYADDYDSDLASYYESGSGADDVRAEAVAETDGSDLPEAASPREQLFLEEMQRKLEGAFAASKAETLAQANAAKQAERDFEVAGWLPAPMREAIIKKAAMEAYYFLFDKEYVRPKDKARFRVRKHLRDLLLTDLVKAAEQAEKVVIVSHSMGTMVAYDVLRNMPECPQVEALFTLGSPLGVREVQAELVAKGAKTVDFPAARLQRWINIYDPLDPVAGADPRIGNDFRPVDGKAVNDIRESNWGGWRHTITHYLAGEKLRSELARVLDFNRG